MPSLFETLEELFQTRDLYKALGYHEEGRAATQNQLKKAYHRSSLKYHPDRVGGSNPGAEALQLATRKFQALGAVYKVLSDRGSKDLYDESGEINEEDDGLLSDDGRDWEQYWRMLFPKITTKDIADFENEYRHSKEEEDDLRAAYLEGEGDMEAILEGVLCSTPDDEQRFHDKISGWVREGSVPSYPAFEDQMKKPAKAKRSKKQAKERKEAEELSKELGIGNDDDDSLFALIKKRQADREQRSESFLDQLEAKYSKPVAAKSSKKKTKK